MAESYNSKIMEKVKLDRFITIAQYSWHSFDREFAHYDLADSMHLMAPSMGLGDKWELGGFLINITPGVPFPPVAPEELLEHWHRQIEKLRELGKPFDFWAIFKGEQDVVTGDVKSACQLSKVENSYLEKEVGDLFWGWDMGEWDGLFCRDVMQHVPLEDRPQTRKEGHDRLVAYLKDLARQLHNNTCTIVGCTFPHYFKEIGIRFLGAEIGQALLNVQVYTSFLRGACRQYDMQFKMITSVFDRWGFRCYTDSPDVVQPIEDGKIGVWKAGKYQGHSVGFIVATWVINYFAGAAVVGLDGMYYTDELDDAGVRKLSPLGEALRDFTQWARKPHPRGRQVRPLAIMLDYYSGWTPPRHLYSYEDRVVWHCIPYGPADHGMDQAYNLFYPGYTWSGFYRDERGFITPTPNGDVIDVLLSDASSEVVADYPLCWLMSDETPSAELLDRLKTYVETGGHLIVSSEAMIVIAQEWFGLLVSAGRVPAFHSILTATNEEIREAFYSVRQTCLTEPWKTVATTEELLPVIVERSLGAGRVTLILADHGLTDDLTVPGFDKIERLEYHPDTKFELLHCVERYLRGCVEDCVPVQVDVPDVYYAVNDIGGGRYVVCLYNPGHHVRKGALYLHGNIPEITEVTGPWSKDKSVTSNIVILQGNQTVVLELRGIT